MSHTDNTCNDVAKKYKSYMVKLNTRFNTDTYEVSVSPDQLDMIRKGNIHHLCVISTRTFLINSPIMFFDGIEMYIVKYVESLHTLKNLSIARQIYPILIEADDINSEGKVAVIEF